MKKIVLTISLIFCLQLVFSQVPLDTAIDFSVKDIDGSTIDLFALLDDGKFVVIDFFSTACASCQLYAPDFQASYEDFGENGGNVFFVSICRGDNNAGVAYFDSTYNLTHPSVSGSQGGGDQVHTLYQVLSTPTVILINPEREIVEQHIWEPTQQNINDAIIAAGGSMVGIQKQTFLRGALKVFPNPVHDKALFSFTADRASDYHVEVFSMTGSMVSRSEKQYFPAGNVLVSLSLGHLPGGSYYARLMRNGAFLSQAMLLIR